MKQRPTTGWSSLSVSRPSVAHFLDPVKWLDQRVVDPDAQWPGGDSVVVQNQNITATVTHVFVVNFDGDGGAEFFAQE